MHHLHAIVDSHLAVNAVEMFLNGMNADVELLGNLLIGKSTDREIQHFPLTVGQPIPLTELIMISLRIEEMGVPLLGLVGQTVGEMLIQLFQDKLIPVLKGTAFLPPIQTQQSHRFFPEAAAHAQRIAQPVGLVKGLIDLTGSQRVLWGQGRFSENDALAAQQDSAQPVILPGLLLPQGHHGG